MNDALDSIDSQDEDSPSFKGVIVAVVSLLSLGVFWSLKQSSSDIWWSIGFLLSEAVLISIVIWQACDPFADAAQWIGETFRVPGSVRGATLDAIASSMPELFSGIFFVVVAITATDGGEIARIAAGAEGYGATIATCAGSAIYNMILIPAICAIVISMYRPERPTIDIEEEVVRRDGIWFVGCEVLLIVFLFADVMEWWMGVVFIGLYCGYIVHLYLDATAYRKKLDKVKKHLELTSAEDGVEEVIEAMSRDGVRVSHDLVANATRERLNENGTEDDGDDDAPSDSAGVLFGYFDIPLRHATAWCVIVVSTLIAAGACYFLVETTRDAAAVLNVPTFFVAVILAAAVSSVPDTFLSIGSAMRGDDSGAVSNAFGSNIFDLCICLSIPLLVNSYLTGWQPVSLLQDGEPIAGLVGLRILLVMLTVVTLLIIWHKRQITRSKAYVLCGLYIVFIGYAVAGSLGLF